ncbi:MAG TPA: hypothetical protein DDW52_29725 [Planctomycetaceae bacterium]|nr:hypothetical protein [Planctomycetaceae bacterium]
MPCLAQGPLKRRAQLRPSGGEDSRLQVKDVEGLIWEFKVMDNKERDRSQKTKMIGRMRIKQTSVFAVGPVEMLDPTAVGGARNAAQLMEEFDNNNDQQLSVTELEQLLISVRAENKSKSEANPSAGVVKSDFKGLLSQRINSAKEEDTGGERIGDLTKSVSSEKGFRFDEDDNYPLSGIVVVRPDTSNRNGVWFGYYDEFSGGKKQKRWRFEMRKIED